MTATATECRVCAFPRQLRQNGAVRFDFLFGAASSRVNPTDIDLLYERNGQFLFIECKRPRQPVSRGQEITFDRLTALPNVRLLVVIGQPPDKIEQFGWWRKEPSGGCACDVRDLVGRWWQWAGDQPR